MRLRGTVLTAVLAGLVLAGCGAPGDRGDVLYQTSTINALLAGVYDGDTTLKQLAKHGDFGIGTFEALDGEMVLLDGRVYQVRADGAAYRPGGSLRTPFAAVTFFKPELTSYVRDLNHQQLMANILGLVPSRNDIYAVKISGQFPYVKTRSVPKQEKPYPPLADVTADQPTFEFEDVEGTLVGFWLPSFMEGVNVPGLHLHFLDKKRKAGGHLLDCRTGQVVIEVDVSPEFHLSLPRMPGFLLTNMERPAGELEKVER